MAIVQGIREKVHLPIYDSIYVKPEEQLRDVEGSNTLRFFVDVQRKTPLETNLQSASLLPHYNTFEARAMRVVISDLPAEFSSEASLSETDFDVLGPNDLPLNTDLHEVPPGPGIPPRSVVRADLDISLSLATELLKEALDSEDGVTFLNLTDEAVVAIRFENNVALTTAQIDALDAAGAYVELISDDLFAVIDDFDETERPLDEQLFPNNGSGNLISKFIYNTVTRLFVGEKLMIQMPTWFFPAGAGPSTESGHTTHGNPSPQDTFRFAEPIFIDKQQNFRVEIEIPDTAVLHDLQRIYGPFWIWLVLDGYMTRGVQ